MKKLILTLIFAAIATFGFSQTYNANVQTSFSSLTITDLTVDTINAVLQYQLNGTELGLHDNVLWVAMTSPVTSTGSFNAPYTSPNTAASVANSGDIIAVAPGTYPGHITFIADSVTLISTGGKDVTFLSVVMVGNVGIDVVDYTTISGFTITGDAAGALIELDAGELNVKIFHNFLNATGAATFCFSGGTSGSDSLLIQYNDFKSTTGDGCVFLNKNHTNSVVDHNNFIGGDKTSGYAIQTSGCDNCEFTNNIIDKFSRGIFPHTATTTSSGTFNILIDGNIISNCTSGIQLGHSSQTVNMDSVRVTNNTCYLNTNGIFIDDHASILVNTFDLVDNRLLKNTINYNNQHSTLTPRSLSLWLDDTLMIYNSIVQGSIFGTGSIEAIDLNMLLNRVNIKESLYLMTGDTLIFGNTNNMITSGASSTLDVWAGGLQAIRFQNGTTKFFQNITFSSDNVIDIGSSAAGLRNIYIGGFISNGSTEILNLKLDDNRAVFKVSLEISAGDTIWADSMIVQGGAGLKRFKITLADDQSYALEDATTQIVRCLTVGQNAFIGSGDVQADGTVTMIGSGSVASTDSDGNLCLFKSGTTAILRNRLGLEVDIVVEILKP